jgi:hypothetical protein
MSFYEHVFEGRLEQLVFPGKYRYFIVRLPPEVAARLPFDAETRVRASGEINDHPFHGAWVPGGDRPPYLHLSADFVRRLEAAVGDPLEVRFKVEPSDMVEVPAELAEALSADPRAEAVWQGLTPGRRRGLAHMVGSARREETRRKRAATLLADLLAGGK